MADGALFDPAALALPVRWIHFASVFALFGSALFRLWLPDSFPRAGHTTDALLRWAAVTAMISGLCWLWGLVATMAGGFGAALDPETLSAFFGSPFGPVAALRLFLLLAAGAAALWATRGRLWRVLLVVSALLLVDQAWLGHAATGSAAVLVAYCVHVLAAAAWVGGLPPLLFALREAGGHGGIFAVLTRFSAIAMVAVALVLATGLFSAGARLDSFKALAQGQYGAALAVKATLVAAMLALACFNRFFAMPPLRGATGGDTLARLRASVAFELFLGAAAIGAAAWLGMTPPH